jgi:hypothetical protein
MEKNKVAELARSFSSSCKQIVEGDQLLKKLPSPAITLVAFTVIKTMLLDAGIDKRPGWGW